MFRMIAITAALIFSILLCVNYADAGEVIDQLSVSIDKVIDILKNKELKKSENTAKRRSMLRKTISESFAFDEMAKRSLATHWRSRTETEKREFVLLFTDLLERSYVNKIESYSDEKIIYLNENIEGEYAVVKTKMLTTKNVEIPVDYKLFKSGSKWHVYDVVIEGVGLVNNYRTQFNKIIRTSSYQDLVKRLQSKQDEIMYDEKSK
ncbi:MAG: ABC transporter substrate-binding protein [Dissulfurispiraceae bacterium]|jgi:phospholipid transport system substrate-binding protein|nr:ABC transporter substrate-binding protein [Dissulfurispiraceae bacterium]